MDIAKIKGISNPYYPLTANIPTKDFVGREKYITKFRNVLDEIQQKRNAKNVLISGEKSVGKSTLLKRFKEILLDYNFYIHDLELSRDKEYAIDEFEFIKEIIDKLFLDVTNGDNEVFNNEQSEIWFSLTSGNYCHEGSDYKDRKLMFSSVYANKSKGNLPKLNSKQIESDFVKICKDLTLGCNHFTGFALVIDEFQELQRNTFLLDTIRKLTELIPEFIIVAAGLPTFLENPSFEKFVRTTEPLTLSNMSREESMDIIYSPLQSKAKISAYEAEKLIDRSTTLEILERTNGNPLHLRILLANLFEDFSKSPDNDQMKLSRSVMDSVMEYYCNNSTISLKIKSSLQSATRDQLKIFSKLYNSNGLSIRAIIMLELAFDSIQLERENEIKNKVISNLADIFDLGLFKLTGADVSPTQLFSFTSNQLSQVSVEFIGDSIDKLYVLYFYEDLTGDKLSLNEETGFEFLLAKKLQRQLGKAIVAKKINNYTILNSYASITNYDEKNHKNNSELVKSFDKLNRSEINGNISDSIRDIVNDLKIHYNLELPAYILKAFEYEGYFLLHTIVNIRGKEKLLSNYFPIKGGFDKITEFKEKITDYSDLINASLDEYHIKINSMLLWWVPKKPWIIIHSIEISENKSSLHNLVREEEYTEAVKLAESIFKMNLRFKDKTVFGIIEYLNNYGFCLINVNDHIEAKKIFLDISEKYFVANLNLAYIRFVENEIEHAKEDYAKLNRKKIPQDKDVAFIHICLKHEEIESADCVAHDVLVSDAINWNLALLFTLLKKEKSIISGFLRKISNRKDNKALHLRVRAWIEHYQNNSDCVKLIQEAKTSCGKDEYLLRKLEKDFVIFNKIYSSEG